MKQRKPTLEVTRQLFELLKETGCLHCEMNMLEHVSSYQVICQNCEFMYKVITGRERIFSYIFVGGVLAFALGWLLAMVFL